MKNQLIILLLIFMAAAGLSTAVSAAPVTHTTQGPTIHGQGHLFCSWVAIKTINTPIPTPIGWRIWIMYHYPPPLYKITSNEQHVLTIWKRVCTTSPPVPTPYKR
ncbi:MAG TPA: hypothetical protein VHO92_03170 [Methanobacterium sp.]|nr:hypothetical protein [Methanobacterium sp.]